MLAWLGVTFGIFGIGVLFAVAEEFTGPVLGIAVVGFIGWLAISHAVETSKGKKRDEPKPWDNLPP